MSKSLRLGEFDLHFGVYTCEQTFYEPDGWREESAATAALGHRLFVCDRLVNGDGGEARPSVRGTLEVRVFEATPDRVRIQLACRHDAAIKAIKIALDVPYMPMLAPEQIGLEEATWREWPFPAFWRTGFAVWEEPDRVAVRHQRKDVAPHPIGAATPADIPHFTTPASRPGMGAPGRRPGESEREWRERDLLERQQRLAAILGKYRYFTVSTQESPWRFKRLRALRTGDRMRLEIVQDASLRERTREFESSIWEIGWRNPDELSAMLDDHARFVTDSFGAADFRTRQDMPDWVRRVGLVVNLHGTDWNGRTNLDFAGMTTAADSLAKLFPPEQTLLYPIGWDGPYMRDYPAYEPSAGLGGRAGFESFCQSARNLGFHVMPHMNAMAVNMRHPRYLQHLKDYVIRDWNGLFRHSYTIDWDHDGLGDPAHAYIALEPPALREILCDAVERLVREFGIDAVFLDETCNVFYNDPAWDQVEGVRRLIRDLHARTPGLLIAGEEWNEMLLGLTPVVQIWEETADGRKGFGREKSPLVRRWASRFIRACGYLALASPDDTTGVHEWPDKPWIDERQNEPFYIPTLSITKYTLERGMTGVLATVERAQAYVREYIAS